MEDELFLEISRKNGLFVPFFVFWNLNLVTLKKLKQQVSFSLFGNVILNQDQVFSVLFFFIVQHRYRTFCLRPFNVHCPLPLLSNLFVLNGFMPICYGKFPKKSLLVFHSKNVLKINPVNEKIKTKSGDKI